MEILVLKPLVVGKLGLFSAMYNDDLTAKLFNLNFHPLEVVSR